MNTTTDSAPSGAHPNSPNGQPTHNGTSNGYPDALSAAIEAARLGYSVIPVNPQTKKPFGEWKERQTTRATPDEVAKWRRSEAFAVVAGTVSGGTDENGNPLCQVSLDFDVPRFYHAWCEKVGPMAHGLPVQRTGGGNFQVLFKTSLLVRNGQLAFAPNDEEEEGREIAIETRGEGGYFVAAPSLHPSGNLYQWMDGDLSCVPILSEALALALLDTARRLDEAPYTKEQLEKQRQAEAKAKTRAHKGEGAAGVSVIDTFNAAYSIEDTLEKYGYTRKGERFVRPRGTAASVTILDGGSFHHSSNDPLCNGHLNDAFAVFCFYEHGGNVKDAVKAAAQELGLDRAFSNVSRDATGEDVSPDASDPRPRIDASIADAPLYSPMCWDAIKRAGGAKPRLFQMGAALMRLEVGEGKPQLREMEEAHLLFELARAAIFTKTKKRDEEETTVVVHPPREYARDMLADPNPPVPRLKRIVEAPVFAPDGTLQTHAGYYANSQTFFHAARGLHVPDVPTYPTEADVSAARELLLRPLREFPFVSASDLANALAFGLTTFARDLIDGPTPLGGIEATGAGTGKGLLADVLLIPAIGRNVGTLTLGKDENDTKNRITAALQSGKAAVLLDNVNHKVESGALASALTSLEWEDRKFISHEIRSYPVRCVWLMTANNPTMSTEIARRYVRIRLNAVCEQAWTRTGFEIPDLRQWMQERRGETIGAYLTLIRAWQAAGKPNGGQTLGSYEVWARVIGGVLLVAGIGGFLGNLREFYSEADTEGAAWRALVAAWHEAHGATKVSTADLFTLATEVDSLELNGKNEGAQKKSLARKLGEKRDTVIGAFAIVSAGTNRKGAALWRLQPLESPPKSADSADSADTVSPSSREEKSSDFSESEKNKNIQPCPNSVGSVGSVGTQREKVEL